MSVPLLRGSSACGWCRGPAGFDPIGSSALLAGRRAVAPRRRKRLSGVAMGWFCSPIHRRVARFIATKIRKDESTRSRKDENTKMPDGRRGAVPRIAFVVSSFRVFVLSCVGVVRRRAFPTDLDDARSGAFSTWGFSRFGDRSDAPSTGLVGSRADSGERWFPSHYPT